MWKCFLSISRLLYFFEFLQRKLFKYARTPLAYYFVSISDFQGRNPADRDALKEINYFPQTRGFETKYFPYVGDKNYIEGSTSVYHSPLVALQLHLDESIVGQLIHIECRVYHKGVWHDTKSKAGLIQFEVMLKKY